MTRRQVFVGLILLSFIAVGISGCGSKMTKDNFDKVKNGMSPAEVKGLLGSPTGTQANAGIAGIGSSTVMTWEDGDKSVVVTFINDKVAMAVQNGLE